MHSDLVGPVLNGNIFQAKNAFAAFAESNACPPSQRRKRVSDGSFA